MKENGLKKANRIMIVIGWIIVIAGFFVAELVITVGKHDKIKLNADYDFYNDSGWTVNGDAIFQESMSMFVNKGETIVLSGTLPRYITDVYAVMLYSEYCSVEALVDGIPIYEYGLQQPLPFGSMVGNVRVIIPVDSKMAGKQIDIYITSYYDKYVTLSSPAVAEYYELQSKILSDNIYYLILLILIAVLVLYSMILYVGTRKKYFADSKATLNLCGMIVLVGAWILCSSDIPQFYTDGSEGIAFVSFFAVSLMGISFLRFCDFILSKKHKALNILWLVGWINPIAIIVCFVLNIADPLQLRPFSYLYLIVAGIMSFVFSVKEWRDSTESKVLSVSIFIIFLSMILSLGAFFAFPASKKYSVKIMGTSFVVAFVILICLMVRRQIKFLEEEKYLSTCKTMAYTDPMTRLGNRVSFEKEFDEIKNADSDKKAVTLFIFDLDHLQAVNDNEGTQVGDMLLIGLAECIHKTFGTSGKCYRIGGMNSLLYSLIRLGKRKALLRIMTDMLNNITIIISIRLGLLMDMK